MRRGYAIGVCLAAAAALACDGGEAADAGAVRVDAGPPAPGVDAGPPTCEPEGLPEPLACNGHPELCGRSYDAVTFPMTHNAMSSEEEEWIAPNQGFGLWRQLEDGVRGFMLDVYEQDGVTTLCHAICALGSRPLAEALADLRRFMACHPAEVLTIIVEPHVEEAALVAAFDEAGLVPSMHVQALGDPWPTLAEMVTSGRRLLVFTEASTSETAWLHPAYEHAWDNDYANETADDLDCVANRGEDTNDLFLLNHFLTRPIAMRSLAEEINHDPFFTERVDRCVTEVGRAPNLVAVDFYDVGDLFTVVDHLNGL